MVIARIEKGMVVCMSNEKTWKDYIDYLISWAKYHEDISFIGMSPASYCEWRTNECIAKYGYENSIEQE